MKPLTPKDAAAMARGVYLLREHTLAEVQASFQDLGCGGQFVTGEDSRFEGSSGMLAWKRLSGFGYIAQGTGGRQGEIALVTRGTDILQDWLSDANFGVERGPSGHLVHAGFNHIRKSFAEQVTTFLKGRNPSVIHCVGHSLGGALANLNADYLSGIGAGKVYLYTFGCPRVGLLSHGRNLTHALGADSIYRVSHQADPVTMGPIFPYYHVPVGHPGYVVRNGGGLFRFAAHRMQASYIPGIGDADWRALEREKPPANWGETARAWLESGCGHSGPAVMSASLLGMIARALQWVLGRVGDMFGLALLGGMTVLDGLAWILSKGAALSLEVAGYVKALIGAIFRFLGRTVDRVENLTIAFLRWVLDLLATALRIAVMLALEGLDELR